MRQTEKQHQWYGFDLSMNQLMFLFYAHRHHRPLPFQVRKPVEVISDDVVILTSWTCHNHNTFVVSLLGYLLHRPIRTNLRKRNSLQVRHYSSHHKKTPKYLFHW